MSDVAAADTGVEVNQQLGVDPAAATPAPVAEQPADPWASYSEEVEWEDGQKYKVPPPLKSGVLREADYRKKTQEIAEQRRQYEEQTKQFTERQQLFQKHVGEIVQIQSMNEQLAEYQKVDWNAWAQSDPAAAQRAQVQMNALMMKRQGLQESLRQKIENDARTEAEERAKRRAALERELPLKVSGWNSELDKKLREFAKERGVKPEYLDSIDDASTWSILHDAYTHRQSLAKAVEPPKGPSAQPVPKVTGKTPAAKDLNDPDLSPEEFAKIRNAQDPRIPAKYRKAS